MKHKHCELIKAWADGAEIQYRNTPGNQWVDCIESPAWCTAAEYRIKLKTIKYRNALMIGVHFWVNSAMNDEQACSILKQPGFVRWLSDWQVVEV